MKMAAGIDNGPVVAQVKVPLSAQDTTGLLTEKLSQVSARLLEDVVGRWVRGELAPRPQDETLATYCHPLRKADSEIEWQQSASAIWRKVRAFSPRPGCFTWWQGKRLKILEVLPLPGIAGEVGKVREVKVEDITGSPKDAIGVGTGAGVLAVLKVQLEGKQAVSAAEFLRGQRQLVGAVLGAR
jgi:methionyl-tRNA formyltransferase